MKKNIQKKRHEIIRAARLKAGLTLDQFRDKLRDNYDITATVACCRTWELPKEKGGAFPKTSKLAAVCSILNIDPNTLF